MRSFTSQIAKAIPPANGRSTVAGQRFASSTTTSSPSPSLLRRYRRAIIWSSTGLALGGTLGAVLSHTLAPPPHPAPGTHEDAILMHDLETRIDNEFKVKVLRGKCTAAAANLRGEDASWRELPANVADTPLSGTAMAGARGVGVERLFWNEKGSELVAVVWFGGATSGWPGVVHGGCIATLMAEKMALAARLTRVAAGGRLSQEVLAADGELEAVEIGYKKPTYANAFYVVRMLPRHGDEAGGSGDEVEVDGVLETLEGKLCVAVTGIVPVSKVRVAASAPVMDVGRAKSWVGWPSRSQLSP